MITDKKEYRILIIEDNPADLALVEGFLYEQFKTPVITPAVTFEAAKALLSGSTNSFDVILLDLSLPDKAGTPLIRDIIKLALNIPVIVLTGYADFDFGVNSLQLGVSDYILKNESTAIALHRSIVLNFERKKIISALEGSEKKYSDLFNLSPLPMWVVDLNTLRFLDVNIATINNYGYSRKEFLLMTLNDITPAEALHEHGWGLKADNKHPYVCSQSVTVHKMKNGDLRNVEVQVAPIMYKNKEANIIIATDITERLQHINAIEGQNEKLREISWMQSHIIRAPLCRIMSLVELIKDNKDDTEEQQIMLDFLTTSANELDRVIKNIVNETTKANYTLPVL